MLKPLSAKGRNELEGTLSFQWALIICMSLISWVLFDSLNIFYSVYLPLLIIFVILFSELFYFRLFKNSNKYVVDKLISINLGVFFSLGILFYGVLGYLSLLTIYEWVIEYCQTILLIAGIIVAIIIFIGINVTIKKHLNKKKAGVKVNGYRKNKNNNRLRRRPNTRRKRIPIQPNIHNTKKKTNAKKRKRRNPKKSKNFVGSRKN